MPDSDRQVDEFFANGVIIRVGDGDTVIMRLDMGEDILDHGDDGLIEIRFAGIDTPEKEWTGRWEAQPGSAEAKDFVVQHALDRPATARLKGDRTYGRFVGEIFVDGTSLNRELVRNGWAWWNKKYERWDLDYERLQDDARTHSRGIWAESDAVPPWEWRRS